MSSSGSASRFRAVGPLSLALLAAWPASAQEAGTPADARWNSDRTLALVRAAVEARRRAESEDALRSYEARAEGHVYFLGEFGGERRLVRADQIALRVAWRAPGGSIQTIVGRRHENRLPARIRYHIDHLSVVVDNFDDRIRLGEGDEVRHVLHPAAPGAAGFYDYRLADSLEIRIRDRRVRVYRVHVRPSRPDSPGVVGTLYVERGSGAIARMAVTFTSAAYVDRHLDYIQLDLRSALWDGRHWLPAEQEVEIRRQVSWLSYPVGGIIRTRFRIFDYRLDAEVGPLPPGDRVTSLPAESLAAYADWSRGLHAGPAVADERGEETLADVRRRAEELVRAGALPGTSRWQLWVPDASGAFRARRAEGVLAGLGVRYSPHEATAAGVWAGWPFARQRLSGRAEVELARGPVGLRLAGSIGRLADIGPWEAASGLLATLAFAADGEDWTDPYFESGGEIAVTAPLAGGRLELTARLAGHSSARLEATALGSAAARPVRPIDEGTMAELAADLRLPLGGGLGARWIAGLLFAGAARGVGDFGYSRALAALEADGELAGSPWSWSAAAGAGLVGGAPPPQRILLVGGRGTVPGHPFRGWGGDRAGWARIEAGRDLVAPWLHLRAHAAAGWAAVAGPGAEAARTLGVGGSGGVRPALGMGVGLLWDILRFDLWRGLDGGDLALLFSVDPDLWAIL